MTHQKKIFKPDRIISSDINSFPSHYYQCVVADPPWSFRNEKTGGNHTSGSCQQYSVMSLRDIITLPVNRIASDDSILFLWISTALKADILNSELLRYWGFSYKTSIYWHKIGGGPGLGFYYRGNVEECLVCVRGKQEAFHMQISNIFKAKRRGHSEKPQKFWDDYVIPVVNKFGYDRNIELFSRSPQPGWDAFGNEVKSEG